MHTSHVGRDTFNMQFKFFSKVKKKKKESQYRMKIQDNRELGGLANLYGLATRVFLGRVHCAIPTEPVQGPLFLELEEKVHFL